MRRSNWTRQVYGIHTLQLRRTDGEITLAEMCAGVIKRLRPLRPEGDDFEFDEIIAELEAVETVDEYDDVKAQLYDWADENRVWIDPTR